MLISNIHGYNIYIRYLVIILISHYYTLIISLLLINSKIYFYKVNRIKKLSFFRMHKCKYVQKKFYTRIRIRVYGFHNWLKFQPFFLIDGDHWLRKRDNYLIAYKREKDLKDTKRITKNAAFNVNLF